MNRASLMYEEGVPSLPDDLSISLVVKVMMGYILGMRFSSAKVRRDT